MMSMIFAPAGKTMRWIEKRFTSFRIVTISYHDLYQDAKFGGDRTTRAGCRSENWCFFLFVTLGLPARRGHSSNKFCATVYVSILMRFSALFSEWIALSGALHSSHFYR